MKVSVLLHEDLVPPEETLKPSELEERPYKTEYNVLQSLRQMGHKVNVVGVKEELSVIRTHIREHSPNIIFNLLEEFRGEAFFDYHIVAYLELLGIKYTGCNPRGLLLARDKALGKKVLKYHRIPTPEFTVFRQGKSFKISKRLKYPLFVKTLNEEASLGISQESVVSNEKMLSERIEFLFETYGTDVIAETYIDGREFYVGMMGNDRLQSFPVLELSFGKLSEDSHAIATRKIKWDLKYRRKNNIEVVSPKELSNSWVEKMQKVSKKAYRALELSGCARMDLRITEQGDVFLIEANPNPDIGEGEEFHQAAELAGWSYSEMLEKLINLGKSWNPR
ncbi:MAG: hypothetical protein KDD22_08015 [Bdellovibrionales bacterium]|nr:hypothetical protein [Bdellovibrionales bacterium]